MRCPPSRSRSHPVSTSPASSCCNTNEHFSFSSYYSRYSSATQLTYIQSHPQAAIAPGPSVYYYLLTNSFSALTFGHDSRQFFFSILKVDVVTLPVLYDANFASFYLLPPHADSSSPRTFKLLDFYTPLIRTGSVVPQGLWLPRSETDRQRHVRDAPLQFPIWLHRSDASLGVSMLHAASGNLPSLIGSQETINIGGRSTIHLRIMVRHSLLRTYGTHRKLSLAVARISSTELSDSTQGSNRVTQFYHRREVHCKCGSGIEQIL